MMPNVVVMFELPDAGLAVLRESGLELRRGSEVEGANALLVTLTIEVDRELLERAGPALRVVANYGVGYNNIDVGEATRRGVLVTNTPGVLTDATADLAFALLLAAARRVVEGDRLVRSGGWTGWAPLQMLGAEVSGATLGIVGAGRIGTAMARRATGFGMRILYVARQQGSAIEALGAERVTLDACLAAADFVSLHVPLTEATRHLIGARELRLMKAGAILVNTSRGAVVDEAALVAALAAGTLGAAGLDVYENEPELQAGLAGLENVVLLPHLGSATGRTRARMAVIAAQNIVAAVAGRRPPQLVNPEAWERRRE